MLHSFGIELHSLLGVWFIVVYSYRVVFLHGKCSKSLKILVVFLKL